MHRKSIYLKEALLNKTLKNAIDALPSNAFFMAFDNRVFDAPMTTSDWLYIQDTLNAFPEKIHFTPSGVKNIQESLYGGYIHYSYFRRYDTLNEDYTTAMCEFLTTTIATMTDKRFWSALLKKDVGALKYALHLPSDDVRTFLQRLLDLHNPQKPFASDVTLTYMTDHLDYHTMAFYLIAFYLSDVYDDKRRDELSGFILDTLYDRYDTYDDSLDVYYGDKNTGMLHYLLNNNINDVKHYMQPSDYDKMLLFLEVNNRKPRLEDWLSFYFDAQQCAQEITLYLS